MKIQISYDSSDIRSGYTVLEHLGDHQTDLRRTKCDITFISPYISDGEAEEILVLDVLTYFPSYAIQQILDHWLSKLAIGGIITVSDIDSVSVAKALYERSIDMLQANVLLHGQQNQPWLLRKTGLTLEQMVEYFEGKGLRVLSKKLCEYSFVISAQRIN